MPLRNYANAPATTLAVAATNVATSITVASASGFPISYPYTLILDKGTATEEAVSVTAAAGTVLTVTRGIDSTPAFAHSLGATVEHGITAQDIREANTHVNATSGVHGATGSVVGTTDTQTLTNKTINLTSNTLTGTKAQFNTAVSDGNPVWDNEIGLWATYTPTLSGFTGTVRLARWVRNGNTVHALLYIDVTAVSGQMEVTLPVAARASGGYDYAIGSVNAWDNSASAPYVANVIVTSGTGRAVFLGGSIAGAYWNPTAPFTWASGDQFRYAITYEAA